MGQSTGSQRPAVLPFVRARRPTRSVHANPRPHRTEFLPTPTEQTEKSKIKSLKPLSIQPKKNKKTNFIKKKN